MNKEQVKRHGKVIKWFCDNPDKGIWYRATTVKTWAITYSPGFHPDSIYVQNDEYAEYRKAQANGKTIQYNPITSHHSRWDDIRECDFDTGIKCNYRIKPDEPKFKVGDWIKSKHNSVIEKADKSIFELGHESDFEKWTPQGGDILVCMRAGYFPLILPYKEYTFQINNFIVFDKVIPYIGQPFEEMK